MTVIVTQEYLESCLESSSNFVATVSEISGMGSGEVVRDKIDGKPGTRRVGGSLLVLLLAAADPAEHGREQGLLSALLGTPDLPHHPSILSSTLLKWEFFPDAADPRV